MADSLAFEQAVDIFGYGFCLAKSLFGPYVYERHGRLAVMRDGPGRKGQPRIAEVVVIGRPPTDLSRRIARLLVARHFLLVAHGSEDDWRAVRDTTKGLGYRLHSTHPFFEFDSWDNLPSSGSDRVRRVTDAAELAQFRSHVQRKPFEPWWFDGDDSPVRLYAAWLQDKPVGWVKSVKTPFGGNWVSDLFVDAQHRRQGLGRELMSAMLQDDRRLGVDRSVLMSSHTGALLYPLLGYRQFGLTQFFSPLARNTL